jgi:hypothetical protein
MFTRSLDCGVTWATPQKLSESNAINQGTVIAVDPASGVVYVAWRRILAGNQPDAILIAKSTDGGKTFTKGNTVATFGASTLFDQPKIASANSMGNAFRSRAFPVLAVDGSGIVYTAWSQRGLATGNDARIVVATSADGVNWSNSSQYVADPYGGRGHQFLPTLSFAGGTLVLAYYDSRDDQTMGVYTPTGGGHYSEKRVPMPGGNLAANLPDTATVFTDFIYDGTTGLKFRHTIDVRAVQALPGAAPAFAPSMKVSQYKFGTLPGDPANTIRQLQFNPPNFPMFSRGAASFIGDYIDIAASTIVPLPGGGWGYNTTDPGKTYFHISWTDNRDVRPPKAPVTWADYTPVTYYVPGFSTTTSLYDPTQARSACVPGQAGMRNQNIYTSRLIPGLAAFVSSDPKPLNLPNGKPRTFSVTAVNPNYDTRRYQMTITGQPAGGAAYFQLGPTPNQNVTTLTVDVPPRSSVARLVYVTSTNLKASVPVSVTEVQAAGYGYAGLSSSAIINPDIANPDIANPDIAIGNIANPDIAVAEIFTPNMANPDIANPDIANPDIANPDIANPDIANPDIANPDIANPDIANPDIANPDIANPDIVNPDIANPDIASGPTDTSSLLTNAGNTTTSYTLKLYQRTSLPICSPGCSGNSCAPGCIKLQLMVHKRYPTPVAGIGTQACSLLVETQNTILSSVANPVGSPLSALGDPSITNGAVTNPTFSVKPGDQVQVTLRCFGSSCKQLNLGDAATPVVIAHGNNTTNAITPLTLTIVGVTPRDALAGQLYTGNVQITGNVGPTTWVLVPIDANTPPPTGVTLNPTAGTLSFMPTVAGPFLFRLQVSDTPVTGLTRTTALTIQVNVVAPIAAPSGTVTLPPAVPGQPYSVDLNSLSSGPLVSGGTLPLSFSEVGSNLATVGLSVSPAGIISGTYLPGGPSSVAFTVLVKDSSCLSASCTVTQTVTLSLKIPGDSTPPVVTPVVSGTLGTNGWYTSAVTVNWTTSDPESGIASVSAGCAAATLTQNSAGQTLTCTATNGVGLSTTASATIKIDTTPPVATPALSGPAGSNGWYLGPVSLTWVLTDDVSGASALSGCGPVTLTASTPAPIVCNVSNGAGLTASGSVSVKIDATDPTIQTVLTGPAGQNGYYGPGTVLSWQVSDPESGIASSTGCGNVTLISAGGSYTCSATDGAGRSNSVTVQPKVDVTPPVIVPTLAGTAGSNGWYRSLTVSWSVTDPESGVSSSSGCATTAVAEPGATLTCNATNGVGLSVTQSVTAKVYATAPGITITTPGSTSYLLNSVLNASYACSDASSGVATCAGPVPNGSPLDTSKPGPGTFTVNATDAAGNASSKTVNYSVGYQFTGFASPLGAAGTFSGSAGIGKAIPVKWTLQGSGGTLITDRSAIVNITAAFTGPASNGICPIVTTGSASYLLYAPTAGATGSTVLRSSGGSYIFNWDTSVVAPSGTGCYTLIVQTADNATYSTSLLLQ